MWCIWKSLQHSIIILSSKCHDDDLKWSTYSLIELSTDSKTKHSLVSRNEISFFIRIDCDFCFSSTHWILQNFTLLRLSYGEWRRLRCYWNFSCMPFLTVWNISPASKLFISLNMERSLKFLTFLYNFFALLVGERSYSMTSVYIIPLQDGRVTEWEWIFNRDTRHLRLWFNTRQSPVRSELCPQSSPFSPLFVIETLCTSQRRLTSSSISISISMSQLFLLSVAAAAVFSLSHATSHSFVRSLVDCLFDLSIRLTIA